MALFGVEHLRLPYWSAEFWALPRSAFAAARIYHEDRLEAEREEREKLEKKLRSKVG